MVERFGTDEWLGALGGFGGGACAISSNAETRKHAVQWLRACSMGFLAVGAWQLPVETYAIAWSRIATAESPAWSVTTANQCYASAARHVSALPLIVAPVMPSCLISNVRRQERRFGTRSFLSRWLLVFASLQTVAQEMMTAGKTPKS